MKNKTKLSCFSTKNKKEKLLLRCHKKRKTLTFFSERINHRLKTFIVVVVSIKKKRDESLIFSTWIKNSRLGLPKCLFNFS